jgi:hypothetical protein
MQYAVLNKERYRQKRNETSLRGMIVRNITAIKIVPNQYIRFQVVVETGATITVQLAKRDGKRVEPGSKDARQLQIVHADEAKRFRQLVGGLLGTRFSRSIFVVSLC